MSHRSLALTRFDMILGSSADIADQRLPIGGQGRHCSHALCEQRARPAWPLCRRISMPQTSEAGLFAAVRDGLSSGAGRGAPFDWHPIDDRSMEPRPGCRGKASSFSCQLLLLGLPVPPPHKHRNQSTSAGHRRPDHDVASIVLGNRWCVSAFGDDYRASLGCLAITAQVEQS